MKALRRVWRDARRAIDRSATFASSYVRARTATTDFSDVRLLCLFIGYPRSGHSLVGSLIDAHPRAVIAHEVNVLDFLARGFSREQIFVLLRDNARAFARKGRRWSGYAYAVPGQWQGRFTRLEVIGDKKGGGTTKALRRSPQLLDRLAAVVGVPVRFIHVIRNPYDNISTMARRSRRPLETAIEAYFGLSRAVVDVRSALAPGAMLDLRYEDLVADPPRRVRDLCAFLGLEAPDDYLRACAGIVFGAPRQTRFEVPWPDESVDRVAERIAEFPMLHGYAYDG
ncbi:MAG TPA: sulfotransferase [bacterium]|jgi:hypothetical protein